jgi:D-3-phosphoglycerate dehydrogenase
LPKKLTLKVLLLDTNHPLLKKSLLDLGLQVDEDYTSSKPEIEKKIADYDGIVIRSRFPIDKSFLQQARNLKFIGRVGAGLENIDTEFALKKGIRLFNAPEGNRNAVGEHTLALILNLFNKINSADAEVRSGLWRREANRGLELDGKTVGIIGYGNMGKAFAKKLKGFDVEVLAYDILPGVADKNARQVALPELFQKTDVLSLHVPQTPLTFKMIDTGFINKFHKNFWLINTARGSVVDTASLVKALQNGKISGAGLDVLEYEKSSFENLFEQDNLPDDFKRLIQMKNVILTPHIAGWTVESKEKLARVIVDKIAGFLKEN